MGCAPSAYSCAGEPITPKPLNVPQLNGTRKQKVQKLNVNGYKSLGDLDGAAQEDDDNDHGQKDRKIVPVQTIQDELENNNLHPSLDCDDKFLDPRNAAGENSCRDLDRKKRGYQSLPCRTNKSQRQAFESDSDDEDDVEDGSQGYRPSARTRKKKNVRRHVSSKRALISPSSGEFSPSRSRGNYSSPPFSPDGSDQEGCYSRQDSNSSKWTVTVSMNSHSSMENSGFCQGPDEVEVFRESTEQLPSASHSSFRHKPRNQSLPPKKNLQNTSHITKRPPISPHKKFNQQRSTESHEHSQSNKSSGGDCDSDDGGTEPPSGPQSAALAKALAFSNTHWRSFYESKMKLSDNNSCGESNSEKANSMKYSRSVSSGFKSLTSISSAETDPDIEEDKNDGGDSFDEGTDDEGYEMHSSDSCYMVPEPQDSDESNKIDTTKKQNRPKAAGRSRSRPYLDE